MEVIEEQIIDTLTPTSVNIIKEKYIIIDGIRNQVGERHRSSYSNSEFGRKSLKEIESTDIVNSIMIIWGDTPLIITEKVEVVEEVKEVE